MSASPYPKLSREIIKALELICGLQRTLTAPADLIAYSYDATWLESMPGVVVLPQSTAEVAAVLSVASKFRIPVFPRGLGSGLSGGSVPQENGIVLSLAGMNRIVEIDEENGVAVVEPGVITATLQKAVEARGFFYPPDPSSLKQSAIGGNVAENAGGARCLKYGVTSDYVLALEAVLADGTIFNTGGKTVKNVTGYNLRALLTGAEGTLAVITSITLRLLSLPPFKRTLLASFRTVEEACRLVPLIMRQGILPASIELMDNLTMRCVEEFRPIGLPLSAGAILLIAFDGHYEEIVVAEAEAVRVICQKGGALEVRQATNARESEQLWEARRGISPALARRRPHKLGEDVAVPRDALPTLVREIALIAATYNLEIPVFGHAGDGNLHPNILCDRRDPDEMRRVKAAAGEIFTTALRLGGTLSGEHGIGLLKKEFLTAALGEPQVALQRRIQAAFDPAGILNPGKIFPTGNSGW